MYYEERPDLVTVTTVGGKYHTTVNYSIVPSEGGFEVESVTVVTDEPLGQDHFGLLVTALVRVRYTADDEFAIARQCVSKVSDYMAYNAWVDKCKEIASTVLGMEFTPDYNPTLAEILTQLRTLLQPSVEELDDEVAEKVPSLFEPWKPDEDVVAGVRRYYKGTGLVYECVIGHRTQEDWTPDVTPNLWKVVRMEEWPEWVQPAGAHDAYAKDAKVAHNGEHWMSDYDGNVWEPGVFGWRKV
jgi:hypothetical protein